MVLLKENCQVLPQTQLRNALGRRPEEVLQAALGTLRKHPIFQGHLGSLHLSYEKGTLLLTGRLPSFYLKQVLQTALKEQPGVDCISNRVDVVSPRGLSSVSNTNTRRFERRFS